MEKGQTTQIAAILKQYKLPNGEINYQSVMTVPGSERLPAMFEKDFMRTTALVGLAIATAFDRMEFKKRDIGGLVNNLAEEILDTAGEDNLGMEDLLLFLQGLVRGKYGEIKEAPSIGKFMTLFEIYRQERHEEMLRYRENEHLQYKSLGDATRSAVEDPLANHFSRIGDKIHELKSQLSEVRKENNVIKQANNFYGE